jgi:hypothetical protein
MVGQRIHVVSANIIVLRHNEFRRRAIEIGPVKGAAILENIAANTLWWFDIRIVDTQ